MTGVALLAQAALVHVIVRMALHALQWSVVEGQCGVALRATDDTMHPEQWELSQIVVEYNVGGPGVLSMAGFAAALELAAMRILTAMASTAVLWQCLPRNHRGMTGVAIDLGVRAEQRKVRFFRVIVGHRLPFLVVVAIIALLTESPGMRVIGLVAAVAVLRDLVLVVATAVAGYAVNVRVHTQQLVTGLFQVVKLRCLPLLGDMALTAVATARATMFIIGGVTADTGLRCLFVMAAYMAGVTSHRPMRTRQLEVGLIVIEFPAGPTRRTMALATRLAELPPMRIVTLVTINAVDRSFAPVNAGLVATVAGKRGMRSLQREVGQVMVELTAAQMHNVSVAALVLGVTGAAFTDTRVGHASVIAVMLPQVAGDLFMAIQAQRRLGSRVGAIVTVRAGLLLLDMGARHLTWHQQCFHCRGMGTRCPH